MSDGLQDGSQRGNGDGHIQQMSGEEEIIIVAQDWEAKVPQRVQEGVVRNGHPRFPHLVVKYTDMLNIKSPTIAQFLKLHNHYPTW